MSELPAGDGEQSDVSESGAPRDRRAAIARAAVVVAAVAGLVHAASSVYWSLGGRWLLDTVGAWAVSLVERSPLGAGVALGAIGVVKVVAAVIPVLVEFRRIGWARWWRTVCWLGGLFLIGYGALNVAVSGLVLAGVVTPEGGYDSAAMIGHAYLWDPLFLVWGLALVVWLASSRRSQPGRPRPERARPTVA